MGNLFDAIPDTVQEERFEDLLDRPGIRIERILSQGQSSPKTGQKTDWYDQAEHEWVLVLAGSGVIAFEDGREIALNEGDYLNIPAGVRHRVKWTDPENITIWLAIFYR